MTDGNGVYQITELRPGTCIATFTLPGFGAVKRKGIELSGTAVTQLNAELRVSTVEETITVTGEAPTVDVQSTTRQQVMTSEVIFRIGPRRATINLDIFNLFNSDTVLTENPNVAVFRRPTGIVLARYLKIGGTLGF